jgi:hypothetical protein
VSSVFGLLLRIVDRVFDPDLRPQLCNLRFCLQQFLFRLQQMRPQRPLPLHALLEGLRLMKREPNLCSIFLCRRKQIGSASLQQIGLYFVCIYIVLFEVTSGPSPPPLHASARRQAAKEDGGEGQCDNKLQHDENEGC